MQISKEGSTVQFQDHHRQMQVPFVIHPDFEALTEKVSGCQRNSDQSYTLNINRTQHVAMVIISCAVMMMNIASQSGFTEVKNLLINLYTRC